MKRLSICSILLFSGILLVGCKKGSNLIGPGDFTWTQCQGLPNNLPVTGFAASGNNLLAGAYNSGLSQAYIYISVNNGSSWTLDTIFHTNNRSPYTRLVVGTPITFLAEGANLFAGIAEWDSGKVYVSTDNGITWFEKDTDFVENVYCFSGIGATIFAGTGNGVFRSTDKGISWIAVNNGLIYPATGRGYPIKGLARVGSNIFACTNGEGIFRSTDSGGIWTEVNSTDYDFQGIVAVGIAVFAGAFAGGQDPSSGGVFVSTDNGNSWSHCDAGLGADHGVNTMFSDGKHLLAGTNTSLFVSSDAGRTWNNMSADTPIDSLAIGTIAVINSQLLVGGTWYGAWHRSFM